ncbi:MAG: hypothetical protein C0524_06235 [Rhodobacter sp.]|nr:hypothetical protein [Rhodobacter sp.]
MLIGEFFGHPACRAKNTADLVALSDLIEISVRPQDWPGLDLESDGKPVISVMAGVPLRALPPRSIRALPDAAAELRQSYTPGFGEAEVLDSDQTMAVEVLGSIGFCEPVQSEDRFLS